MLKRPYPLVWGAILLLVILLLNLPDRTAAQLKLALSSIFVPLFRLESTAKKGLGQAGDRLAPRNVLNRQIESLEEENTRLKLELQQFREAARENRVLREMLEYPPRENLNLKAANVVGGDPENWWRTLLIDQGKEDGMKVDMPVLCPQGLVGKIFEVQVGHSQVLLLGDPQCRISAMVFDTGETGIIQPRSETVLNPLVVDFSYLPNNPRFQKDQWVITSGKGGVFPRGIPIGTIVNWQSVGYGTYTKAQVRLSVNFNRLERVFVLMP